MISGHPSVIKRGKDYKSGADPWGGGGGSWMSPTPTPFEGPPNFEKWGENVACVCANAPRFST